MRQFRDAALILLLVCVPILAMVYWSRTRSEFYHFAAQAECLQHDSPVVRRAAKHVPPAAKEIDMYVVPYRGSIRARCQVKEQQLTQWLKTQGSIVSKAQGPRKISAPDSKGELRSITLGDGFEAIVVSTVNGQTMILGEMQFDSGTSTLYLLFVCP